jgi:small subunit ribosomal protein S20
LANSLQATKRARQAVKHHSANASKRSAMRTHLKRVKKAIEAADKDAATSSYQAAVPAIDRMANRGLIHKNKAARHKSRLNAAIRAL